MAEELICSQPSYLINVTSGPILWVTKFTFFLFYLQLFRPLRWFRISVYVGAALTTISYAGFSLAAFILATPRRGETWEQSFTSSRSGSQTRFAVPVACVGLLIDIYILILPSLAISTLNLKTARKVGLLVVFGVGFM